VTDFPDPDSSNDAGNFPAMHLEANVLDGVNYPSSKHEVRRKILDMQEGGGDRIANSEVLCLGHAIFPTRP
jgi:hypothetical protein